MDTHPHTYSHSNDDDEILALAKKIARAEAVEALSRVFFWIADGKTIEDCGFRSMVAISTIRRDIYSRATLEQLGQQAGRQRQAVWKLQDDFKKAFAL